MISGPTRIYRAVLAVLTQTLLVILLETKKNLIPAAPDTRYNCFDGQCGHTRGIDTRLYYYSATLK